MNKVTLLPADIYQVINKSLLSEMDKLVLNMLYIIFLSVFQILYNFSIHV